MFASSFRLGALRRSFALYSANTKAAGGAALKPLERNIQFNEIIKPLWVIEPPNYLRQPLLKQFWEAQFANRSFFFFGNAWTSAAAFAAFLWWSRVFGKALKANASLYFVIDAVIFTSELCMHC